MKKWKKVKLKDVLNEVSKRNKGEKVKTVLSVTNSHGFVNQEEYFEGTVHSENISNYKIVKKNQFAYNPSRINVGSIDILKNYAEGALSPMYVIFETDKTKLLPEYFKYYFQTHRFFENVKNNTQGSVRNSLSFKALSDFDYLLPSIEEQEKIVKILDNVDLIIKRYEELLKEKNQFIKSQFTEMFRNEDNYVYLGEVCTFINGDRGKNYPSSDKISKDKKGIPFINAGLLINNTVDWDNMNYISEDTYNKLGSGKIQRDDILYCLRGSLGKHSIIDFDSNGAIASSLVILRADKDKIQPNFLLIMLGMNEIIKQQYQEKNGSSQPNLSASSVKKYKIKLPNMEMQTKFVDTVNQIDEQKCLLEKQVENYRNLKKALMQQLLTGKIKVKI